MPRRHLLPALPLIVAAVLAPVACGGAPPAAALPDAVEEAGDGIRRSIDGVVSDIVDAVDAEPLAQRRAHCDDEGGAWIAHIEVEPCRDGHTTLHLEGGDDVEQQCASGVGGSFDAVCAHYDADGRIMFNDGPSVPHPLQAFGSAIGDDADIARWNEIFWASAINHDYCYHHNGSRRGLTQQDCDRQLFSDLSAICVEPGYGRFEWFSGDRCRNRAALFFASVRGGGASAYAVMDTNVDYPEWQPLWQQFGMAHDVADADLAERIERYVGGDEPRDAAASAG